MFRLARFKNLWSHKLRFVLTSLAVVLGVAFMAGTMVLTDTMSKSFDELFASANSGVDVIVQQPAAPGADAHGPRERVPSAVVDQVRSVDGVDAAAGTISGLAQLVQPDGTVAKSGGLGATIGMNWVEEHRLNPLALASGHSPRGPDEVVIDKNTVDRDHRQVGDRVTVITPAGNREFTLVGTATFGALDGMPGSTLVAFDDATAQTLFAPSASFDAIAVATRPGPTQAEVAQRIDVALGTKTYDVVTGEADTANKQEQFRKDISFFHTFLLAFAYVSLFVAVFIISNTFSITVAQRTKDMAMLRAIGARRRQIIGSVVLESTVVGLLSGVIGLFAGVGMSFGLKAMLDAIGIQIPNGPIVLSTATIVTALTVGLVVTVASALLPALRAGRIAPIAALRDSIIDASGSSRSRTIAGTAIAVAGLVLFGAAVNGAVVMQVGLGAALTIVGVFVLGPILARPFASIAGAPVAAVSGIAGGLARENAKRSPKRTAATASALMIGVALVAFMTILAASMKTSVSDAVDRSFRADYVVAGPDTSDYGTLSPAIEDELRTHPQIGTFSPVRTTTATVADTGTGAPTATKVEGVDTKAFDQLYDVGITAGSLADAHDGGIAIKKSDAEAQHKAVGDTVTVTFARTGAVTFTVGAIFDQGVSGSMASYLVDLGDYRANVTDQMDRQIYVKAATGVDRPAARAALDAVVAAYPNAAVQDQSEFKSAVTTQIDQMLNLIYGLLALAVIIALIGIANTLALSVHERTRELGLLRAVGMSRRQVRSSVRWESVLIALFGTVVGTAIAIGGAWGMVKATATVGASSFVVPVPQLAIVAGIAIVAGMAAAVGPARRAAGMNVLEAISQS